MGGRRGLAMANIALAVVILIPLTAGCFQHRLVEVPAPAAGVVDTLRGEGYAPPRSDRRSSNESYCGEGDAPPASRGCVVGDKWKNIHYTKEVWVDEGFRSRLKTVAAERRCKMTAVVYEGETGTVVDVSSAHSGCEAPVDESYENLPSTKVDDYFSFTGSWGRVMPYFDYAMGRRGNRSGVDHRFDFGLGAAVSLTNWGGPRRNGFRGWRHDIWLGTGIELSLSAPGRVARPKLSLAYSQRRLARFHEHRQVQTAPTLIYELSLSSPMFLERGVELSFTAPLEYSSLVTRVSWGLKEEPGVSWFVGLRIPLLLGGSMGLGGGGGGSSLGGIFRGLFTFGG